MTAFNVICPFCGKVNHGLYLEETHGWMECENCHQLANNFYPPDMDEKVSSIQTDNIDRAPLLSEVGC